MIRRCVTHECFRVDVVVAVPRPDRAPRGRRVCVSLPFSTRSPRSLSPRISPILPSLPLLFTHSTTTYCFRVSLFVSSLPPAANAIVSFEKRRSLHASLRRKTTSKNPGAPSVSSFGNSFDSLDAEREREREGQLSRTRRLIDRFYGLFRSRVGGEVRE